MYSQNNSNYEIFGVDKNTQNSNGGSSWKKSSQRGFHTPLKPTNNIS